MKDVKDNADKRDAMGVAVSAKKEQQASQDLLDKAKELANAMPSPQYKKDVLDAADKLEKAIPYQLAAAKKALESPSDPVRIFFLACFFLFWSISERHAWASF